MACTHVDMSLPQLTTRSERQSHRRVPDPTSDLLKGKAPGWASGIHISEKLLDEDSDGTGPLTELETTV